MAKTIIVVIGQKSYRVDIDDDECPTEYPETLYGDAGRMHHVGNGAYCDDDGDNWDFL